MFFVKNYWDGLGMNYSESFWHTVFRNISPLSAIFIGSSILILIIIILQNKYYLNNKTQQEDLLIKNNKSEIKISFMIKILEFINIISFWIGILLFSIIIPLISSFEFIAVELAILLMIIIYALGIIYQIWRISSYVNKQKFLIRIEASISKQKLLLLSQGLILLAASITVPSILQKGCLCIFSDKYGINIQLDIFYSTQTTRGYWYDQICKDDEICQIYATLPQDTMHSVIINVHTGRNINSLYAELNSDSQYFVERCTEFPFPSRVDSRGQRRVYSCLFQNLFSNTEFDVKILHNNVNLYKQLTYRTLPSEQDQQELIILFGGDYGNIQEGRDMANHLLDVNPHVVLIGGDVTYDNGIIHCYYSQDQFIKSFSPYKQKNNIYRIVPFIFSVGNHDVGFNDYSNYNITVSGEDGPLYFTYYPMKLVNNSIPQIKDRTTYNYHIMQNLLLFGLDTGYLHSHESQVQWVKDIIKQYPDYTRFAHYHVPMYPTCAYKSDTGLWPKLLTAQKYWLPLFDDYQFKAVFENHVHQFKRTFPLKNGKRDNQGTVYFGDGSMGIKSTKCTNDATTYQNGQPFAGLFDTVITGQESNHYWVLHSYPNGSLHYEARSPNYQIIVNSTYEQKINLSIKDDL